MQKLKNSWYFKIDLRKKFKSINSNFFIFILFFRQEVIDTKLNLLTYQQYLQHKINS